VRAAFGVTDGDARNLTLRLEGQETVTETFLIDFPLRLVVSHPLGKHCCPNIKRLLITSLHRETSLNGGEDKDGKTKKATTRN
jgi:hypothetical protein